HETLLEIEISRMKMTQKPRHVTPVDYTKLNALYDQFVPQKQLSREQVYWLSASDIASQSSDPPKPVTPFVHTRFVNSEVRTKVWKIKECYGELKPVDGVLWLRNLCRPGAPEVSPPCCLCPVTGGAMKPTTDGRWANLACAMWILETCLSDIKKMEPVDGMSRISKDRVIARLQQPFPLEYIPVEAE
nr:histone-lysine N-methyltransferase ATX2-like isoform X1 [Tanacetum cinerariifolium]